MKSLLKEIEGIIHSVNPEYNFVFETNRMMNVRADDKVFPVAFWEEYTQGQVVQRSYGVLVERTQVEVHFMRNAPRDNYQCDAVEREALREQIKEEIVYDFIKAVNLYEGFAEVTDWEMLAEPPLFDDVAVSILVRFWVERSIC